MEWATITLKDAAGELFTDGDWVESKDQDPDGEVRLIQLADIGDGTFLDKSARFLTAEKSRQLKCTMLKPGDLLIARMADPIARCCLYPGLDQPAATVVDVSIVRPGSQVDREYLAYAVSNPIFRSEALGSASGTTRSRISRSNLGAITLPLPPLDEQRRIAEVLRSVDKAIAANDVALRQRDRIRTGFGSLFQRGLGHSEFQPSSIGEIPASWQVSTMKDICHNVGVGIASSATHAYAEQGIPLLRNQNIKPGHLDLGDLLFVNEEYDRSYATKRVRSGDIITMRTGYPGRSAIIPPELDGCQTFTTLISRPKKSVIDPAFLCAWINSKPGMMEIKKRQAGGAQQNLNAGAMEQVPVPLPPLDEQRQIASILSNFPTEDDALISKLRNVRKLIQADLLSGRVRVPA